MKGCQACVLKSTHQGQEVSAQLGNGSPDANVGGARPRVVVEGEGASLQPDMQALSGVGFCPGSPGQQEGPPARCVLHARKARSQWKRTGGMFGQPRGRLVHRRQVRLPAGSGVGHILQPPAWRARPGLVWREAAWRQGLLCGPRSRLRSDGGGLPSSGIPNAVLARGPAALSLSVPCRLKHRVAPLGDGCRNVRVTAV